MTLPDFGAQEAIDAAFETFGAPAVYLDAGLAITVIRRSPDETLGIGGIGVAVQTTVLEVRRSELPDPQAGAVIALASGERRVIQGVPQALDDLRLVWTLDTRPEEEGT